MNLNFLFSILYFSYLCFALTIFLKINISLDKETIDEKHKSFKNSSHLSNIVFFANNIIPFFKSRFFIINFL